jgi:hypothetical protein
LQFTAYLELTTIETELTVRSSKNIERIRPLCRRQNAGIALAYVFKPRANYAERNRELVQRH